MLRLIRRVMVATKLGSSRAMLGYREDRLTEVSFQILLFRNDRFEGSRVLQMKPHRMTALLHKRKDGRGGQSALAKEGISARLSFIQRSQHPFELIEIATRLDAREIEVRTKTTQHVAIAWVLAIGP